MPSFDGRPGELTDRLLDLLDQPGPQLRALATTLLIKALDMPGEERQLMEAMVASDDAAAMIDPVAAAAAGVQLRHGLGARLSVLASEYGEAAVVRTMRDHLLSQVQRWATRAVDDADNRRRAERFLAWAERPGQLEAAQRRGLFAGMDAVELRRMAEDQVAAPVSAETALSLWADVERWTAQVEEQIGEPALEAWADGGGRTAG